MGRGKFQELVGSVRRKTPVDSEWLGIRYFVFDAPNSEGGFEARLESARRALIRNQTSKLLPQMLCEGKEHLYRELYALLDSGAEGVMLRAPQSAYEPGRSSSLLKVKPTHTDEARVIEHKAGTGRNENRVGSLLCSWKGMMFSVGSGLTEELCLTPPKIGSTITFSCSGFTRIGVPRHPVFVCERNYEWKLLMFTKNISKWIGENVSTYYKLICEDHKERTNAASRTAGGYCELCDSTKTLVPFIIAHHRCRVRIVFENEDEAYSEDYRDWTEKTVNEEVEKAQNENRWE
jgi:hypothetical protein